MPNDTFTSLSGPCPSPLAPSTHREEAGTSLLPRKLHSPSPPTHGPPQWASPVPQIHHLTCCGVWALLELACLLARRVSWGSGCRLLFKPQIPGAGRQSRQRRGWREGMQSPGPCSRGRHQQKATVSCVLPVHPTTWSAAWEQPLGTPGLSGVLPPPLPALESEERCEQA